MKLELISVGPDKNSLVGKLGMDGDRWVLSEFSDQESLDAWMEKMDEFGPASEEAMGFLVTEYTGSRFFIRFSDDDDDEKKGGGSEVIKIHGEHKYATAQLELRGQGAADMLAVAESIPSFMLEPTKGRETNPHVTVLYGLVVDDHDSVREALRGIDRVVLTGPLNVDSFDGVEDGTCDAVIVRFVKTEAMDDLRARLTELPHVESRYGYQPHVTLGYVKLGQGSRVADLLRPKVAKLSLNVVFDTLTFRDRLGRKHDISLNPVLSSTEEQPGWKTVNFVRPIRGA